MHGADSMGNLRVPGQAPDVHELDKELAMGL